MDDTQKKFSDTSFIIYSDGACSGNPGPGGWGAVVYTPSLNGEESWVDEIGGGDHTTTNNRMELTGVAEGLKLILEKLQRVQELERKKLSIYIFTDSVYVIRGITQWIFGWIRLGWKNQGGEAVANKEIWIHLHDLVKSLKSMGVSLDWNYVRGHTGDHGNERCDEIAVSFSKRSHIHLDSTASAFYRFDILQWPKSEPLPEMKSRKPAEPNKKSWYIALFGPKLMTFSTWSECEAAVKGRSGVKFKKVSSEEEQKMILKQWGHSS